ncbi:MAG: SPOR domain-containing protein [Novosphingobium sp.]
MSEPHPIGVNGPSADYPIVVGNPFTIDGTTYSPSDRLNYDEVGYAAAGGEGGEGVTIAHKTLPLPSYAEVTALDSGKTVLVRVERRGPMVNDRLVEFSPGAATQLGLTGATKAAIRIRRVNPPEMERAMLRGGRQASARMDTPPSLLTVLKRRLDPSLVTPPAPLPDSSPSASPTPTPTAVPKLRPTPTAAPAPRPTPKPRVVRTPAPSPSPSASPAPATGGSFLVQVGSFANTANATAVSGKVGGSLRSNGRISRVVMGPFATRAQAEAALARARAAGYRDAQIQGGR